MQRMVGYLQPRQVISWGSSIPTPSSFSPEALRGNLVTLSSTISVLPHFDIQLITNINILSLVGTRNSPFINYF